MRKYIGATFALDKAKALDVAQSFAEGEQPKAVLAVNPELEACFPGLEAYLGMLDKAVRIGDGELITHIADKMAAIFGGGYQKAGLKKQKLV